MPDSYDVGELVVASDDIDVDGVLTDPGTLTVSYRKPDGTEVSKVYGTNAEVVRDGTGMYHIDITTDSAGEWAVRFASTGLGHGARELSFHVRTSRFD